MTTLAPVHHAEFTPEIVRASVEGRLQEISARLDPIFEKASEIGDMSREDVEKLSLILTAVNPAHGGC